MPETWKPLVSDDLKRREQPFLKEVEVLLQRHAGGEDSEAYWYLSWRLELASIDRNLVDHAKARQSLFESQGGRCGECREPLGSAKGHDVHKRERIFARHQGYVPGNTVLLHRRCHEVLHQREPH